ncbi:radical SAM protein [Fibrisoma montanum]|uniref:Radical SAM protein n=1 Tax=Fibrisoma montanum TaxID=2305895 RepID=A0A418MF28_9BACT|nr:radical SAM protein [Fibrisoma montanum]RIV25391.1 radical SAM protein [Fibrisoma montanum]
MILEHTSPASTPVSSQQTRTADTRQARIWMPKRVVFTPDALDEPFGQQIYERVTALNLPIEVMKNNRITGLRGADERETYRIAKNTLAVVNAPKSAFRLQPIPPSADWQMNLAEGCPAHCQYCYLAGSLAGPPVVRVYANLPKMLESTAAYEGTYPPNRSWQGTDAGRPTTFEVSCYTDVLGIEHLTGSLAECIRYYGTRANGQLRFVTKYDQVDSLLDLPHNGQTRARVSLNADAIARRLEGGTASVEARLQAIRKLALPKELGGGGYPIGLVIAPIMPIPDWRAHYTALLDRIAEVVDFSRTAGPLDMNVELISHRFTPGSKDVLTQWYPNTTLDMDEATRAEKRNKFGGTKYVYKPDDMKELKAFFYSEWQKRFPDAPILYWT